LRRRPRTGTRRQQPLLSFSGTLVIALILGLFLFTGFSCETIEPQNGLPAISGQSSQEPEGVFFQFDFGHKR
jgi:hypothetical protein